MPLLGKHREAKRYTEQDGILTELTKRRERNIREFMDKHLIPEILDRLARAKKRISKEAYTFTYDQAPDGARFEVDDLLDTVSVHSNKRLILDWLASHFEGNGYNCSVHDTKGSGFHHSYRFSLSIKHRG